MKPKAPRLPPKDPARPSPQYGRTYPADHLTRAEVDQILAHLDTGRDADTRNRALVGLLWTTGARISEALALHPHDLDPDRRTVRILRGKGGKARTASIAATGLKLLEPWRAVRDRRGLGPETRLLCTLEGRPLATAYVRKMLPRVAREAGVLKRVHPHIFRHTFAVELVQRGVPLPYIQQLLGHANLGTTDKYLRSLSPEAALDAARALDW